MQVVLDCPSGIAGNLWMAAMLGLGADFAAVADLPARLGVPHVGIDWRHDPGPPAVSEVVVHDAERTPPTDFAGMLDRVRGAGLSTGLCDIALDVLRAREEAEARHLGLELPSMQLHGEAVADTLLDIVGGVVLWDALGRPDVLTRAAVVAGLRPRSSSAELLDGIPFTRGGADLVLVTPTGAALLRSFWRRATVCGPPVREVSVPGDFSRAANLAPLQAALHQRTQAPAP